MFTTSYSSLICIPIDRSSPQQLPQPGNLMDHGYPFHPFGYSRLPAWTGHQPDDCPRNIIPHAPFVSSDCIHIPLTVCSRTAKHWNCGGFTNLNPFSPLLHCCPVRFTLPRTWVMSSCAFNSPLRNYRNVAAIEASEPPSQFILPHSVAASNWAHNSDVRSPPMHPCLRLLLFFFWNFALSLPLLSEPPSEASSPSSLQPPWPRASLPKTRERTSGDPTLPHLKLQSNP